MSIFSSFGPTPLINLRSSGLPSVGLSYRTRGFAVFLAVAFLTAAFFAGAFLAGAFFAAVFFFTTFLTTRFLAAGFLAFGASEMRPSRYFTRAAK
ncbi:MAG TPA: hypothetical protein ENJ46_01260 [Hellea balneolensis]|uniref:Uncharacterized protein n=1 Tax=Hellea balneolensis TaxID=287478 RepID=A0A7C3C8W7_9PROT|nr:hypothetical protein [Hellea balneolensis]